MRRAVLLEIGRLPYRRGSQPQPVVATIRAFYIDTAFQLANRTLFAGNIYLACSRCKYRLEYMV